MLLTVSHLEVPCWEMIELLEVSSQFHFMIRLRGQQTKCNLIHFMIWLMGLLKIEPIIKF